MARLPSFLIALLFCVSALWARPVPLARGPLPRALPTPPLTPRTLSVQRVIDSRFPELTPAGWEEAKAHLITLLRDLYNLDVTLEDRGVMAPPAFFRKFGVAITPPTGGLRDTLLAPLPERAKFVERIRRSIKDEPKEKVAGYLPPGTDPKLELHEAIAQVYETRANALLNGAEGVMGKLEPETLGLVTMAPWSAVMRDKLAPEVMITNLPIAYGWRDGTALHALVRGGLIGGFASFSGASRFQGGAMITINPLLSPSRVVRDVAGPPPAPAAAARATGALMAHELSHLMFHVGDNYTHEACLMHPPPGLDYHRWWFEAAPIGPCPTCNRDARIHEFARAAGELADAGRLDDAVAAYAKAVAAAPERAELLNEAAWFCAERRIGLDLALEWAREGVRLQPKAPHILDTLGWIEALTGRTAPAIEHLALARTHAERDTAEITFHLALAYFSGGRWPEGAQAAREAFTQGHRPPLWKPAETLWKSSRQLFEEGQRFF